MLKKIGFFHFGVNHNDPIGSLQTALHEVREKEDIRDSLIVLPEGFNLGKYYKAPGRCNYDRVITGQLKDLSRKYNVTFVAGLIIEQDDSPKPPYNSTYLIDESNCLPMCHKLGNDGTGNYTVCPNDRAISKIVPYKNTWIGALICMDALDNSEKLLGEVDKIVNSNKIICIPASANPEYFGGGKLGGKLDGEKWKHKMVILANSESNIGLQCNSFITNKEATIIVSYPGDEERRQNKILLSDLDEGN